MRVSTGGWFPPLDDPSHSLYDIERAPLLSSTLPPHPNPSTSVLSPMTFPPSPHPTPRATIISNEHTFYATSTHEHQHSTRLPHKPWRMLRPKSRPSTAPPKPATRTAQAHPLAVFFQLQISYGCCSIRSEISYKFIRRSYEQSASTDTKTSTTCSALPQPVRPPKLVAGPSPDGPPCGLHHGSPAGRLRGRGRCPRGTAWGLRRSLWRGRCPG